MRINRGSFSIELNEVGLIEKRSSSYFGHTITFFHKNPVVIDEEIETNKFKKVQKDFTLVTFFFNTEEEVNVAYSKIMDMLNSTEI